MTKTTGQTRSPGRGTNPPLNGAAAESPQGRYVEVTHGSEKSRENARKSGSDQNVSRKMTSRKAGIGRTLEKEKPSTRKADEKILGPKSRATKTTAGTQQGPMRPWVPQVEYG